MLNAQPPYSADIYVRRIVSMRMHLNNFDQVDIFNLDRRETCRETHVANMSPFKRLVLILTDFPNSVVN